MKATLATLKFMVLTRNAEATQQRLIEAALMLYAERGYAGTCLDAILERASSSKGAFYHHFASKEQLTARALTVHWENLLEMVRQAWAQGATPAERLDRLLGMLEPAEAGCPLGLLGFESRSLPPLAQEALVEGLERWSEQLAEMLLELGLSDRQQARGLAERLFLMYEGGVLAERISGKREPLKAALQAWRQEVCADLAAREPAR